MRDILFRGKIDHSYDRKSEWVYGYFTRLGLNDKNGTKIFEGDIVKTEQIIPVLGTNIFAVEYAHGNYFIR